MMPNQQIPDEYLDLTIRSILAGMGRPSRYRIACPIAAIHAAVSDLAARVEIEDASGLESDSAWLSSLLGTVAVDDAEAP